MHTLLVVPEINKIPMYVIEPIVYFLSKKNGPHQVNKELVRFVKMNGPLLEQAVSGSRCLSSSIAAILRVKSISESVFTKDACFISPGPFAPPR